MKTVALFGGSTRSKSSVVSSQRRLNVYFENRPDGDKTKVAIYGTPGMLYAYSVPNGFVTPPARSMAGASFGMFYIIGSSFVANIPLSSVTSSISLGSSVGNCSITASASQVLAVDGLSATIYKSTSPIGFYAVNSFPAAGAVTCTYVSGFFVAEQPGTQQFWVSNFNDGTMWNPLAFASASAYPDTILAVDNLSGILITFSTQHIEFWTNAGTTPQPFAPLISAVNEFGLAAINSRVHLDQSICFLGQTRTGKVQFCQIIGYNISVISDSDIDSIINGFSVKSDAVGLAYQADSHKFYQVSFPTANRTFLYDTSTRIWSEVQTGPSIAPTRHLGNLSAVYNGVTYVSSYTQNAFFTMDPNTYTDNGTLIPREIVTRHVFSGFNRIRISLVYLDMETGVGSSNQLFLAIPDNPQIMLQSSKDNGRTWSAERWVSLGMIGQYLTRVLWRRFGSSRDYLFKIRMTDPVKFVITDGAIKIAERPAADKLG